MATESATLAVNIIRIIVFRVVMIIIFTFKESVLFFSSRIYDIERSHVSALPGSVHRPSEDWDSGCIALWPGSEKGEALRTRVKRGIGQGPRGLHPEELDQVPYHIIRGNLMLVLTQVYKVTAAILRMKTSG